MQVTVRLNKRGVEELEKIKQDLGTSKNAPAIEQAISLHIFLLDQVAKLEKKVKELEHEKVEMKAVISYLESK